MEEALRALLVSDSAVSAIVQPESVVWGRRIGLPALALHLISGRTDQTMSGPSGLGESVVQVDCWGSTYLTAARLRDAVKHAVAGHRDDVLRGVFAEAERSDFEMGEAPTNRGEPANFHRISLDLRVWHRSP